MLWTDKYAPKNLEEVIGNPSSVEVVRKWTENWSRGVKQKPLLLFGPSGCGKSSLAHAVASEHEWEILETNASDVRSKKSLEERLLSAVREGTLMGNRRLIIIDEVDGISGRSDRGALTTISSLIGASNHPMILIANDPYLKKINTLKGEATFVELKKINPRSILSLLEKISKMEKLDKTKEELDLIVESSRGDIRAAVTDLQHTNGTYRDKVNDVFTAMGYLFKADSFKDARKSMWDVNIDPEMTMLWIEENIPNEYESAQDIHRAYEALSRADVFEGRIRKRMYWGLRRYSMDLATAGVSLAKEKPYAKFTRYRFPTFLMSMSNTVIRRAILKSLASKIGPKLHLSRKFVINQLPFLSLPILKDPSKYDLTDPEIALLENVANTFLQSNRTR